MSQERACPKHFKGRSFFHFFIFFRLLFSCVILRLQMFATWQLALQEVQCSIVSISVLLCSVFPAPLPMPPPITSTFRLIRSCFKLFQSVSKVSAIASIGSKPSATGCRCCGGRSGRKLRNTFSANDFDFDFPRSYVSQRPLRGSCAAVAGEKNRLMHASFLVGDCSDSLSIATSMDTSEALKNYIHNLNTQTNDKQTHNKQTRNKQNSQNSETSTQQTTKNR